MKPLEYKNAFASGLTLLELLLVIALIAVLTAVLLPANGGKSMAYAVKCGSQLKRVGANFAAWSQEHENRFPMQVPVVNGGSMEFAASGSPVVHFQALTNSGYQYEQSDTELIKGVDGKTHYLTRRSTNFGIMIGDLVCPSDQITKKIIYRVESVRELTDTNVSYFVGLEASTGNPKSILAGDRQLQVNGQQVNPGFVVLSDTTSIKWSSKTNLHMGRGNLLFTDGHVEWSKNPRRAFSEQNLPSSRLAVP